MADRLAGKTAGSGLANARSTRALPTIPESSKGRARDFGSRYTRSNRVSGSTGESSNWLRTAASKPANGGSSPSSPAILLEPCPEW
jgi:hypothetical protein